MNSGDDALEMVRAICLRLPQAVETSEHRPAFRVGAKSFVMYMDDHHGDGRLALWCKAAPGAQDVLTDADSERFFVPPYVGKQGWIGIRLDRPPVDWALIESLIIEAYVLQAPRKLAAQLSSR